MSKAQTTTLERLLGLQELIADPEQTLSGKEVWQLIYYQFRFELAIKRGAKQVRKSYELYSKVQEMYATEEIRREMKDL